MLLCECLRQRTKHHFAPHDPHRPRKEADVSPSRRQTGQKATCLSRRSKSPKGLREDGQGRKEPRLTKGSTLHFEQILGFCPSRRINEEPESVFAPSATEVHESRNKLPVWHLCPPLQTDCSAALSRSSRGSPNMNYATFLLRRLHLPCGLLMMYGIFPRTSYSTVRYLPTAVLQVRDSASSRLFADFHRSANIASVVIE